jgi:amidase
MLDYSAAVFPVNQADESVDIADPNYKPLNSVDQRNWEACEDILSYSPLIRGFPMRLWTSIALTAEPFVCSDDAQIYHGAPIGLQVVARRYEEEKVLAIASLIEDALNIYGGR